MPKVSFLKKLSVLLSPKFILTFLILLPFSQFDSNLPELHKYWLTSANWATLIEIKDILMVRSRIFGSMTQYLIDSSLKLKHLLFTSMEDWLKHRRVHRPELPIRYEDFSYLWWFYMIRSWDRPKTKPGWSASGGSISPPKCIASLLPYSSSAAWAKSSSQCLESFKVLMMLQGASNVLPCKSFPATLQGAA